MTTVNLVTPGDLSVGMLELAMELYQKNFDSSPTELVVSSLYLNFSIGLVEQAGMKLAEQSGLELIVNERFSKWSWSVAGKAGEVHSEMGI